VRLYHTRIQKQPDRRAQQEAEHRAGRALLCRALGCREDDIRVRGDGKPYLPGGPWFSISHSGGLVLLAVSGLGEVGCDVEDETRPLRNPERIREKIALPGEEGVPLLRLWVKKEAVFKAGGGGRVYYPAMPDGYVAAVCCAEGEEAAPAEAVLL
jgi:phosphopantetheinyl transferase